jgi:hypothetical protein
MKGNKKKGDIEINLVTEIILMLIIVAIILFIYLILSGKGSEIVGFIKNLFLLRR